MHKALMPQCWNIQGHTSRSNIHVEDLLPMSRLAMIVGKHCHEDLHALNCHGKHCHEDLHVVNCYHLHNHSRFSTTVARMSSPRCLCKSWRATSNVHSMWYVGPMWLHKRGINCTLGLQNTH